MSHSVQELKKDCCSLFNKDTPLLGEKGKARLELGLKITALAVSLLLLTVAVLALLVNMGVLSESFPLSFVGQITQYGTGALLTASAISTVTFTSLLVIHCQNKPKGQGLAPEVSSSSESDDAEGNGSAY